MTRYKDAQGALMDYARRLMADGFDVYVPTGPAWRHIVYARTINGTILAGNVQRQDTLSVRWEHHMPIRPSREHGSSMFVDDVPETSTLDVADARKITRETNRNSIVGRHKNDGLDQHVKRHYIKLEQCDCDPDEMLPCEQHMDVIAQREGASTRTADDLLGVWVDDAISVDGVEVSPWGQSVIDAYEAALASNDSYGCRWLPEGSEGLMDDMSTLRYELETSLATLDQPVYTHWDDGYVMYRISDDSPLAGE